jgi:alpha,alpha-trehalose-phosphate synthase [UDP-forming]/trehalose-phosphatase
MVERGTTPENLAILAQSVLGERMLIVVSNREPYEHIREGGHIRVRRTMGGLTAALDPIMRALGGGPHGARERRVTWIAWGSGSADREASRARDGLAIPTKNPAYRLRRVWLTKKEVEKFYDGHVNQTLWPLCHAQAERVRFRREEWETYQRVNRRFAKAVREELGAKRGVIWFQDYHFATAPGMFREQGPGNFLAQFWHIPWPPWEIFRMHPKRRDLLEGLMGCDLIGMHTDLYCQNFLECVQREFGYPVNFERQIVLLSNHTVRLKALPISIDAQHFDALARTPASVIAREHTRASQSLTQQHIGIGVERSDYTKGILERLRALDLFFDLYPSWRGKFTFLQVTSPSRSTIPAYQAFQREVRRMIKRMNDRLKKDAWRPIVHIRTAQTQEKLAALYRMADVAIVSSLQDGMNLVAKEFIASQVDGQGVLILSEFAGASDEMPQAIPINPYDTEGFARAIHRVLLMPLRRRTARMRQMRLHLFSHTVYDWMAEFFRSIAQVEGETSTGRPLHLLNHLEHVALEVQYAPHIALFCDYDGVLTPIAPRPQEARLDEETRNLLRKIRDSARIRVTIISGRSLSDIADLVSVERLTFAGNHGLEISGPRVQRIHPIALRVHETMDHLYHDFQRSLRDFSGVIVENKRLSLTIHYRLANPSRIADILQLCHELTEEHNAEQLLRITTGKKILEVRPNLDWDKGRAVLWILRTIYGEQWERSALPIYLGDDETDEDVFRALGTHGITIFVGSIATTETSARYTLESTDEVRLFLDWLIRTAIISPQ